MDVVIVTFDDFTDLDLFILWGLLTRVEAPSWRRRLLGGAGSHTSSTGVEVKMHGRLEEANAADAVLFCSGRGSRAKVGGEKFLRAFPVHGARRPRRALDPG